MGVINVAWRKAMVATGQDFTKEEQAKGWPETLNHFQLAALQYPFDKGDRPGRAFAVARVTDIESACQNGAIAYTAGTCKSRYKITKLVPANTGFVRRDLYGQPKISWHNQMVWAQKDVPTNFIAAHAFSGWLATQGETPSMHIAAWFDALAVDQKSKEKAARLADRTLVQDALLAAPIGQVSSGIALNGRWIFSVGEAIQEVERDLGHAFTEQEFLDFAAHHNVVFFAVAPPTARVSIRDLGLGMSCEELGKHGPRRFILGLITPPQLKEILIRGEAVCKLPVGYDELADRMYVFQKPFVVSRADLRVGPDSLRVFITAVKEIHASYPEFQYQLPERMRQDGGSGGLVAVAQLRSVKAETEEPANWSQLVDFRRTHVGTEWTQNQKEILKKERGRRINVPGAYEVAKKMALELDISVTRLNDLIKSQNEAGKREKARGKAA